MQHFLPSALRAIPLRPRTVIFPEGVTRFDGLASELGAQRVHRPFGPCALSSAHIHQVLRVGALRRGEVCHADADQPRPARR